MRTFKQRFWFDDFYPDSVEKESRPVMLCFGGIVWDEHHSDETPQRKCADMIRSAKENGALALILETRFYGRSRPVMDTSVGNLSLLSMSQIVQDFVGFYQYVEKRWNVTASDAKHPWIVFGHGLGGTIAALTAQKFPSLVFGAVASAAPVRASVSFPQFGESMSEIYGSEVLGGSSLCLTEMKTGFAQVGEALGSLSMREKIYEIFYQESPSSPAFDPLNSPEMQSLFGEWLQSPFRFAAFSSRKNAVRDVCEALLDGVGTKTSLQRLGAFMSTSQIALPVVTSSNTPGIALPLPWIPFHVNSSRTNLTGWNVQPLTMSVVNASSLTTGTPRHGPQAASATKSMTNVSSFEGTRLVLWQLCTELGWFESCASASSASCPFAGAPRAASPSVDMAACQLIFGGGALLPSRTSGVTPILSVENLKKSASETNIEYGGGDPRALTARVLWTVGELDPWRYLSLGSLSVRARIDDTLDRVDNEVCHPEGAPCSFAKTTTDYPFRNDCCAGLTCQSSGPAGFRMTCGQGSAGWSGNLAVRGAPNARAVPEPPRPATMIVRGTVSPLWTSPPSSNDSESVSDARDAIADVVSRWIEMRARPMPAPTSDGGGDGHFSLMTSMIVVVSVSVFLGVAFVGLAVKRTRGRKSASGRDHRSVGAVSHLPIATRKSGGSVSRILQRVDDNGEDTDDDASVVDCRTSKEVDSEAYEGAVLGFSRFCADPRNDDCPPLRVSIRKRSLSSSSNSSNNSPRARSERKSGLSKPLLSA